MCDRLGFWPPGTNSGRLEAKMKVSVEGLIAANGTERLGDFAWEDPS
jgi:hypothetical protein